MDPHRSDRGMACRNDRAWPRIWLHHRCDSRISRRGNRRLDFLKAGNRHVWVFRQSGGRHRRRGVARGSCAAICRRRKSVTPPPHQRHHTPSNLARFMWSLGAWLPLLPGEDCLAGVARRTNRSRSQGIHAGIAIARRQQSAALHLILRFEIIRALLPHVGECDTIAARAIGNNTLHSTHLSRPSLRAPRPLQETPLDELSEKAGNIN